MNQFSYQNIITGDGFGLALTGMGIVFVSLVLVAGAISQLPNFLRLLDKIATVGGKKRSPTPKKSSDNESNRDTEENELMTAIGLVIHLELDRASTDDRQKITISKRVDQRSAWAAAGKMKTFSRREKYA